MTIRVDVEMVRQHRLGLLADGAEIERRAVLDRPDAGTLTAVTEVRLDRIEARAQRTAELLRELGDALDQWLVSARATDGEVAWGLDLLTSGVLAL